MKRLLQVCFIAAMVFGLASCTKEDNNANGGNGSTSTPTSLVGTEWTWNNGSISFTTATDAIVTIYNYHQGRKTGVFNATYTYSNGSGELKMTIDGQPMTIQFTVSGNTLTAKGTPDGDVTATRANNNNPQPGPNPGGDVSNSLVGTGWMWTDYDDIVVVEFGDNGQVGIMVGDYGDDNQSTFMGTYTYSNGNGTISVYVEGQHYNITFTVNGNTLTAYNTPGGTITFTRMGGDPNPGPNPGGDVSNSLVGTSWMWTDYDDIVAVEFFDASQVYIIVGDYGDDDQSTFIGTYTYSNGNGAISVYIEGQHYNITFTVNGNTLTAYNTPGGTITFTRMGSNPNPGPNPGGDVSNSLVGTGWMWTDYDDIVVVEFGDNGQVGIMVGDYGDDNQSTFMGTYTYSNGNGTISVYVEGQHYNITFTVNGNTLTAYNTPGGTITMTREYK